jgi:sRNA-binding protein
MVRNTGRNTGAACKRRAAIAALQERWPQAFPKKGDLVRPLASKLPGSIAEATGWSRPYARAVLKMWKLRDDYCRAVLAHDRRYDLNGAVTDEPVEELARTQARARLAINQEARARRRTQAAVDRKAAESQPGNAAREADGSLAPAIEPVKDSQI